MIYDSEITVAGALNISAAHTYGTQPAYDIIHFNKSSNPVTRITGTSNGTGTPSATLNSVPANSLLYGIGVSEGDIAAPGGYTEYRSGNGWHWEQGAYLLDSGAAGNQTISWGASSAHSFAFIAYSDEAAGGSGNPHYAYAQQ